MDQRNTDGDDPEPTTGGADADHPDEPIEVSFSEDTDVDADPEADPGGYAIQVRRLAAVDPVAAGDHVGPLLDLVEAGRVDPAGRTLDVVGMFRPEEFEVHSERLARLAGDADEDAAFVGLRSLARLAAEHPAAAAKGLDAARSALSSSVADLRQAALAIVAEIGGHDPEAVQFADRDIAAALRAGPPGVRAAGALAAGRVLGADPATFPRTADALYDALDAEDDRVRQLAHVALVNFAREHPDRVPRRRDAIRALEATSDEELRLERGAVEGSTVGLLKVEAGLAD